jgi:putative endonuclease
MDGYVHILANMRRGRTYIGLTNDLVRGVYEHREVAGSRN